MAHQSGSEFLGKQYARYCLTLNLPTGKRTSDYLIDLMRVRLNASYMVGQWEKAPTTGQVHWQGYVEFSKKRLGNAVRKEIQAFMTGAFLTPSRGTAQENKEYCNKSTTKLSAEEGGGMYEYGEAKQQGERTDIAAMVELIRAGAGDEELLAANPQVFCQYAKSLGLVKNIFAKRRTGPSQLVFLWGETGLGKTAQAMKLNPQPVRWRDPFIIGYNPENPVVLFDDFDWSKMDVKYWLTLCDRYPMTVEVKGGHVNWAPETIIFTSNDDPKEWWPKAPEVTRAAVLRRMEEFGDTTQFGTLVPHTQTLLTRFLQRPSAPSPPVAGPSGATSGGEKRKSPEPTQIIDLTQDSDDDASVDSQPSVYTANKRKQWVQ